MTTASSSAKPKKVRFDESADTKTVKRTGRPPVSTGQQKHGSPTRIVIGKAHPLRDLCIFSIFLGIILYSFSGVSHVSKKGEAKTLKPPANDPVAEALKTLAETLSSKRSEPCSVFVDRGSIPRLGMSFFAGEDFSTGDAVLSATAQQEMVAFNHTFRVSPFALVLKHHPVLFNVETVLYSSSDSGADPLALQLTATREISAGEELFVQLDPLIHNMSFWSSIPLAEDYAAAYEIAYDAIEIAKLSTLPKSRRKRGSSPSSIYGLLRRSVARFNTRVASILPGSQKEAHDILAVDSSMPSLALQNNTLNRLRAQGSCLQDIIEQSNGTVSTAKNFKKGDIVAQVPVIALPGIRTEDGECASEAYVSCFPHPEYRICPVLPAPPIAEDTDEANVKWQWMFQMRLNELGRTEDWRSGNRHEWTVVNVVATKTIPKGTAVSRRPTLVSAIAYPVS